MAKIKINTDNINNSLLPALDSNLRSINNCINSVEHVDSTFIDSDWNSIKNGVHDCYDNANSFKTWITDIRDKVTTDSSQIVDDVNSIEVTTINKVGIAVK